MLRIVTDGAADMPAEWISEYQINVLPLRVNFGEKTYLPGINFSLEDFYRMVRQTRIFPKTSLPSIGQIIEFYRSVAQKGDTILSVHISGNLSGTFSAVQTAARELADEFKIYTFDSKAGSAVMGYMCREARILSRAGLSADQIVARLGKMRDRLSVYFTLENLEFAYLSGRINAVQNLLSSILSIKPIIVLKNGLLEMAGRARTRQHAIEDVLKSIAQRVGERGARIAVVHACDPEIAQHVLDRLKSMIPVKEAVITDLALPVAAHLGPGAVGIVAIPVEEEEESR